MALAMTEDVGHAVLVQPLLIAYRAKIIAAIR